jgi:hypothetical protein
MAAKKQMIQMEQRQIKKASAYPQIFAGEMLNMNKHGF